MAADLDGLMIIRGIVANPRLFPELQTDVNAFARKLITGKLKKIDDLKLLKEIHNVIGMPALSLVLEDPTLVKSLTKKLDKCYPRSADKNARKHLIGLAEGTVQPITPIIDELVKVREIQSLRTLHREVGSDAFGLALTCASISQLRALTKRLDEYNPDRSKSSPDWNRAHVSSLATGVIQPSPAKSKKSKNTAKRTMQLPTSKKPIKAKVNTSTSRQAGWSGFTSTGATRKR